MIGKAYRLGLREHVNAPKLNKPLPVKAKAERPVKKLVRAPRVKISKPDPVKVAEVQRIAERAQAMPAPAPLNFSLLDLNHGDCPCHVRMSVGRGTESERNAVYVGKAA